MPVSLGDLEHVPALARLDPGIAGIIAHAAVRCEFSAGDLIVRANEPGNGFFVLIGGEAAVLGAQTESGVIAALGPGDLIGEVAVLDGAPRSADVVASTPVSALFVDPDIIERECGGQASWDKVRLALLPVIVQRLRSTTAGYVDAVERELSAVREAQRFGQFLVYMITLVSMGTLASYLFISGRLVWSDLVAWQYLAVLLGPAVALVYLSGIPPREFGLTLKGWKRAVLEGIALGAVLTVLAFVAAAALRQAGVLTVSPGAWTPWVAAAYGIHAFGQEFIARGLLQGSLQRFLVGRSSWIAVVLTSVLFAAAHINFGPVAVLVLVLSSVLFGALYVRHRNLIGVTIVHAVAGFAAFHAGLLPTTP